jgi:hypothetical protein
MTTTQIEWVTKEQAGVLLGSIGRPLSSRRVLELAKEGRIESGKTKDPATNQMVVRLHAGSIERYLDQRRNPEPTPQPREVREPQPSHTLSKRLPELVELMKLLREGCAIAEPAHLWLTLQQAAEYSGLPAAVLVEWITAGRLFALDVGRRRGGRWRIRKIDIANIDIAPLQSRQALPAHTEHP